MTLTKGGGRESGVEHRAEMHRLHEAAAKPAARTPEIEARVSKGRMESIRRLRKTVHELILKNRALEADLFSMSRALIKEEERAEKSEARVRELEAGVSAAQWWVAHSDEREAWLALYHLKAPALPSYPPPRDAKPRETEGNP